MAEAIGVLLRQFTATIADGTSLSAAVDLDGYSLVGLYVPSGWNAADITLQSEPAAAEEGTYLNVYDASDNELTIQAGASRFILLDPSLYISIRRVKVRSGTAGSPVNQTGDVDVTLLARPI